MLLLLLAVALAIRANGLYPVAQVGQQELRLAIEALEAGGLELTATQAAQVEDHLKAADVLLARLEAELRDPAVAVLSVFPPAGEQRRAGSDLLRAVRLLTSRHELVGSLMKDYVAAGTGEGPERIAALVRFMASARDRSDELAAAMAESDRIIDALDAASLVGPLATLHATAVGHLDRVKPMVAAAGVAAKTLPAVMGVGGEKRYLVFALDNAEVRPVGGLMAAFATPRLDEGLLEGFTFRDILEIDKPQQDPYVAPPEALRGHLLGRFSWQVADAGWWPEFALSAAEARRMYAIETGDTEVDGTIAFTPELVDALLEIVGPIEIPEAGITVHAGETYLVSLEQVEILNRGPDRKRFLAQLASEVVARLYALPPNRYPEVIAALDQAGKRRQLQIFLHDPAAQAWMTDLGWYTPFTFPPDGDRLAVMEANVAPVSKLHVLVDLDHVLEVDLGADGNANERLVTTYTNRFGPDLPPELRAVDLAFRFGNLGTYQRRYLHPDARDIAVRSDGVPPLTAPERLEPELGSLAVGNYHMVRPGTTHLETTYLVPQVVVSETDPAVEGTYRLSFFKQAGRDRDTLHVSVTVPPGTRPVTWSEGGSVDGSTVSFSTTTELDRVFEVTYATD